MKDKPGSRRNARTRPRALEAAAGTVPAGRVFVGIDLHKVFLQVAAVDGAGALLLNRRVENSPEAIRAAFSVFPEDTKYVVESSSVWRGVFRQMQGMGLDVVLSNPYRTRLIAESRDKTDANDARRLADLLRGGYIHVCHVPGSETMDARDTVRFRVGQVRNRIRAKNQIQGILLQRSVKIPGTSFSVPYVQRLRDLGDWRIDEYLTMITHYNERIAAADKRIHEIVRGNRGAQLLTTIPGVGAFTAVTVTASIDTISRFRDPDSLISYIGLAPSVRNSAGTIRHGNITRFGDRIVRWVLTEAVHSHNRFAPSDGPIPKRYVRLCGRMPKSKAVVAAAAQMLTMMFFVLRDQIDYDEFVRRGRDQVTRKRRRHKANLDGAAARNAPPKKAEGRKPAQPRRKSTGSSERNAPPKKAEGRKPVQARRKSPGISGKGVVSKRGKGRTRGGGGAS